VLTAKIELLAALSGLFATSMAVGGFLAHSYPAIMGRAEVDLRRATAAGGLVGLVGMALALLALGLLT
jgi:hypothetical protein